ncbi:uncharacterized protein LOC128961385 [Oppia nitens]|uniref:uncharacterized protein LOC128961385 n=1 Tax=Oppia nitens TaxID=1686743 RepID=UPI0023DA044C|nr:uncharacterized protein LOC128961385 [Oppia nitens]
MSDQIFGGREISHISLSCERYFDIGFGITDIGIQLTRLRPSRVFASIVLYFDAIRELYYYRVTRSSGQTYDVILIHLTDDNIYKRLYNILDIPQENFDAEDVVHRYFRIYLSQQIDVQFINQINQWLILCGRPFRFIELPQHLVDQLFDPSRL